MAVTKYSKIAIALVGVAMATPSYAYLDPGTGSVILQSLLAGIAVAMGLLRFYWHQFKIFLGNLMGNAPEQPEQAAEELEQDSDIQNPS